jgi:hypothetical protein
MLLDKNLSLKIDPVAQFHELMRIARIAILAGKLASAIGIDRPGKRKVPRANHPAKKRSSPERKVLDIMPLPNRLPSSGKASDAD